MNVLVVGLGKLGAVMASILADAGNTVHGVDKNKANVTAINSGAAPVDEPGLADLIAGLEGDLTASVTAEAVADTDIAMIVVPTPSLVTGGFDPAMVLEAVTDIGERLRTCHRSTPYTIVVCSTLMPGQMENVILPALEKASGFTVGQQILLAYSPEFIALGTVIKDMRTPDIVLVGARDRASAAAAIDLSATFRSSPVFRMGFTEAELTKLAINGYLSVKIGYANMIAATATALDADPHVILEAIGSDSRIGHAYLKKGGPPSGPCLPRDLVALEALGRDTSTRMSLATAARDVTTDMVERIRVEAEMGQRTPRHIYAVLGVAYKPGSNITDDSLARKIIQYANFDGHQAFVYDPHAALPPSYPWQHKTATSLEAAISSADVVIIGCPHPEFDDVDFGYRKVINPWA